MSLKFTALSGTISVTENLYLYESQDKMIIVDCGVGFPDLEMHGIDLVIPDFSYIVKNKEKLIGILISQGHEDHLGALPFLFKEVNAPIWGSPLVSEFIKDKFEDQGMKVPQINTFDPKTAKFDVGPFTVHPFRVTHSVPDSCGFAIDTPEGRIFHVPEHKMDQKPVDGMPFDMDRIKWLAGEREVLFLASDCIGSNKPGYSSGELEVEPNLLKIAEKATGTLFMTAISSNIGRFQQMLNVSEKLGRKAVFIGRSTQRKTEIAHDLGYLKYPKGLVISLKDAEKLKKNELTYIVSGCYGQVGSSLYRIAIGDHDRVSVSEGDTMIFSADPAPPYTKESENFVIDQLVDRGVDVHYYELNEGVYASGHGRQEDILDLGRIVKPKHFIPIGGEIRYMHAYEKLIKKEFGDNSKVFKLKPGDNVIFENGRSKLGERIPTKEILVHGTGIGDIGKVVLSDREVLGNEGFVVVVYKLTKDKKLVGEPDIISRGFVFEKISKKLLNEARRRLRKQVMKKGKLSKKVINEVTSDYLTNFFYQKTGRHPMILPVIVEV